MFLCVNNYAQLMIKQLNPTEEREFIYGFIRIMCEVFRPNTFAALVPPNYLVTLL